MAALLLALAILISQTASAQTAHYHKDGNVLLPDSSVTTGEIRSSDAKELCAVGFRTKKYRHTTNETKLQMCALYGMPWHCWGPGGRKLAIVYATTHDVFAMRHALKMRWIDAVSVSTKVIDFLPIGNRPSQHDPKKNVGANSETFTAETESSRTIATRFHPSSRPQPAAASLVDHYLGKNSFGDWPTHAVVFSPARSGVVSFAPFWHERFSAPYASDGLSSFGMVLDPALSIAERLVPVSVVDEDFAASATNDSKRHDATHFTKKANPCVHGCEGDHLIPLELGGLDDIRDLWPEPYYPVPGARTKDKLEQRLRADVCNSKIGIVEAQRCIRSDWGACYAKIFGEAPNGR